MQSGPIVYHSVEKGFALYRSKGKAVPGSRIFVHNSTHKLGKTSTILSLPYTSGRLSFCMCKLTMSTSLLDAFASVGLLFDLSRFDCNGKPVTEWTDIRYQSILLTCLVDLIYSSCLPLVKLASVLRAIHT